MKLDTARENLAEALRDVHGVTAYEHRPTASRPMDAWPVLRSVRPSTFGSCEATFDLMVILSGDEESAARAADTVTVDLINSLGASLITPIAVVPLTLTVSGAELFSLAATVLIEVE